MDGTIRSVRAARPARNDAGAVQLFVWDAGAAMNRLAVLVALFAVLTLGSCNKTDNTYQGWIEANLIFVGPDEVGRVQTLSVREGDVVKAGNRCSRWMMICSRPTWPRSKRHWPTRSKHSTVLSSLQRPGPEPRRTSMPLLCCCVMRRRG